MYFYALGSSRAVTTYRQHPNGEVKGLRVVLILCWAFIVLNNAIFGLQKNLSNPQALAAKSRHLIG